MPLYRYRCDFCGHTFRNLVLQSGNGEPVKVCKKCGQKGARRVISRVGVVYKSRGFHCTDYGPKAGKETKTGDSSDSKSSSED